MRDEQPMTEFQSKVKEKIIDLFLRFNTPSFSIHLGHK